MKANYHIGMALTLLVAVACLTGCSDDKQPLEPVGPETRGDTRTKFRRDIY